MNEASLLLETVISKRDKQERLVDQLRKIHSSWEIEFEEEIKTEDNIDHELETTKNDEEQEIAEIDRLLSQAQLIIDAYKNPDGKKAKPPGIKTSLQQQPTKTSQSNKTTPIKNENIKVAPKPTNTKVGVSVINSSKKKTTNPVYMNAPYQTQPVNMFKRSKSSSVLTKPASPATSASLLAPTQSLGDKTNKADVDPKPRRTSIVHIDNNPLNQTEYHTELITEIKQSKRVVKKAIPFKQLASSLSLPPKLANLMNNNLKQGISIESAIRQARSHPNQFINRLEEIQGANLNMDLIKSERALSQFLTLLDEQMIQLNQSTINFKESPKVEQFVSLFKLKILIRTTDKFLRHLNKLYPSVKASSGHSSRKINSTNSNQASTVCKSHLDNSSSIILYENERELVQWAKLECDLLETQFRIHILDLLDTQVLPELLERMNNSSASDDDQELTPMINSLLSLALNKRTSIIRESRQN